MLAMTWHGERGLLRATERPRPVPGAGELLLQVLACGVCRTDLHVVDGELPRHRCPVTPGHEIVARVLEAGRDVDGFTVGQRVGVPWLGRTCGRCRWCLDGHENLCDGALFTGYDLDGGFADCVCADSRYCFPLPAGYGDAEAAPLLCAGLIGHRALRMAGDARRVGLYGFGAAAHIIAQVAVHERREVYAFTRPGDTLAQRLALSLGSAWAGDSSQPPPVSLDAALLFAPVGALVPASLRALDKRGVVVCAGIHMSDIPGFPYAHLWGERAIRSVANLTRRDASEFLALASRIPLRTEVHPWPLAEANDALAALRTGAITGAAVLLPRHAS